MIIKPSIRSNVFLNAHPKGIQAYIQTLFHEAQSFQKFKGPKNVLIIGGSSGYGLASRVALAVSSGANTLNVSFEGAPSDKRTGTAGFWNNVYFLEEAHKLGTKHIDVIADAFSETTKKEVIARIKKEFGKIDLVIYSLAAGARPNPETGDLVRSALKPIGEPLDGDTIDVATKSLKPLHMDAATEEDIKNTVYVMGGSDWESWITHLDQANVLDHNLKTISYTYVGSGSMDKIYRAGTIGKAKDDLEATSLRMHAWLKEKYHGESLISSSKAVVTKASVFIPGITSYIACLFDVMKEKGVHETTLAHKHRLFKDMVYGDLRRVDNLHRIRIDHYEMQEDIQEATLNKLDKAQANIVDLQGTHDFVREFHHIHGFEFDHVNYEEDIDLSSFKFDHIDLTLL